MRVPFLGLVLAISLTFVKGDNQTHEISGSQRSFEIDYKGNGFLKDGKKFQYVSGSIHYFRSTEEQWEDLLRKCRLAGLNTITTYVAWNLHQEASEEKFSYDGNLNLFKFIEIAQKNDLLVILRPGPYIDSERDMGGLPAWLLWEKPDMKLRTSDLEYVYFVSRWFDELLPKLEPYLYENGGPIIMVQVENEYGSYACDKEYTGFLRDLIRFHLGEDVVLFSTDGAADGMVKCGSLPGVYPTVDFGAESPAGINSSFSVQRKYAASGPLINSEFYPGWIDHWQKPHSKVGTDAVANALDAMLAIGGNVNIYIFHGGTSFGFSNGANIDGGMYDPNPTSYDFDAPLSEAGDPTAKYFGIKKAIAKHIPVPEENPSVSPKGAYGKVNLKRLTGLFLPEFLMLFGGIRTHSALPKSFEELQVSYGFVLYQVKVDFIPSDPAVLTATKLKDRAYIYVDNEFQGILSRQESIFSIPIIARNGQTISLLVENQGRVCYGSEINESKGPGTNVTLGSKVLRNWEIFPIGSIDGKKLTKYSIGLKSNLINNYESPLTEIRNRGSGSFFVGNFTVPASNSSVLDTFVRLDGFTKGMVWINGFNLGRYWPVVGPQETLYLPAPLLKPHPETNTFLIFELERAPDSCLASIALLTGQNKGDCFITLTDTHVLDIPTPFKSGMSLFKKH
ncbi:unnamed protein product [Orchesella dallaii]|uniref:Beta-galactosidase n=1 Tax=Orchesella dallaii TaxID=48710 RepID=A0ABP1RGC4_9HEXA